MYSAYSVHRRNVTVCAEPLYLYLSISGLAVKNRTWTKLKRTQVVFALLSYPPSLRVSKIASIDLSKLQRGRWVPSERNSFGTSVQGARRGIF